MPTGAEVRRRISSDNSFSHDIFTGPSGESKLEEVAIGVRSRRYDFGQKAIPHDVVQGVAGSLMEQKREPRAQRRADSVFKVAVEQLLMDRHGFVASPTVAWADGTRLIEVGGSPVEVI